MNVEELRATGARRGRDGADGERARRLVPVLTKSLTTFRTTSRAIRTYDDAQGTGYARTASKQTTHPRGFSRVFWHFVAKVGINSYTILSITKTRRCQV